MTKWNTCILLYSYFDMAINIFFDEKQNENKNNEKMKIKSQNMSFIQNWAEKEFHQRNIVDIFIVYVSEHEMCV